MHTYLICVPVRQCGSVGARSYYFIDTEEELTNSELFERWQEIYGDIEEPVPIYECGERLYGVIEVEEFGA